MRVASEGKDYRTIWAEDTGSGFTVNMIDQNKLPFSFAVCETPDVESMCGAISDMTIRGAGAIGAAAAFGMAMGFQEGTPDESRKALEATRPTAKNLTYATQRVYEVAIAANNSLGAAVAEAEAIATEDIEACQKIGAYGAELLEDGATVMTHCNAGWLAFVDWGTALSPIYVAHRAGRKINVIADETQPRQQGARLTAWELSNEGVGHKISPDTAMANVLNQGEVDCIIVGADRIAANGDTANKIGTHLLAIAAKYFDTPFYVAAPPSTMDLETATGKDIPIEFRSEIEVTHKTGWSDAGVLEEVLVTNPGSSARNPAFDVTPAALITGIITPKGIIKPTIQEINRIKQAA